MKEGRRREMAEEVIGALGVLRPEDSTISSFHRWVIK